MNPGIIDETTKIETSPLVVPDLRGKIVSNISLAKCVRYLDVREL